MIMTNMCVGTISICKCSCALDNVYRVANTYMLGLCQTDLQ